MNKVAEDRQPDRSRIPESLQSLDWRDIRDAQLWGDRMVILAAVPVVSGDDWLYEFSVVCLHVDEYFSCYVEGEPWGWDLGDVDFFVTIRS